MLMTALSQINAILRKEMLDGLRDRRSLMSALLFPLLGPVLCAVLLSTMASSGPSRGTRPTSRLIRMLANSRVVSAAGCLRNKAAPSFSQVQPVIAGMLFIPDASRGS